ncbi:hypothetical protein Ddye_014672 [Dipteronia dyeriana]|uniref:Reverse transcriptase domain-containing protein n=1 Tax=Dipteronia dyeriana TaxID=168575 RepID=A0AAD9X8T2_9ROSI|nr:hypothetical protein Ddye_014672 [Dipteronia dyeriana]
MLDFKKAYNSSDHSFLDFMLKEMSFGYRWRKWAGCSISTPRLSILVNGSLTRQFGMERGLRQGDPLSPFLFNVVIEGLSAVFKKAEAMDLIKGISFGGNVIQVTHLQFTDNTILFLQPIVDYLRNVRKILRCFEVASGLRINFQKSCVVKIGKRNEGEVNWTAIFKSSKASLLISYLGFPLGAQKLEKLQQSFFWGDGYEKRKMHLVKWETLCQSKCNGVLGIGSILDKNKGLLVVGNLYEEGSKSASLLKVGLCVVMGRGDKARLWTDIALDGMTLKEACLIIFSLACNKSGTVSDFGGWEGSIWKWNILLRRTCFNWEIEQWDYFKNCLDNIKIREFFLDTIGWSFCPDGLFSVKSFHRGLESSHIRVPSVFKSIWQAAEIQAIVRACVICVSNSDLIGSMAQATIEFSSRDTNSEADALAKKGAEGGRDVLFWNLP